MKLSEVITALGSAPADSDVSCRITNLSRVSRIYVVGQVRPDIPGAILGDREPELREKRVGDLVDELGRFGDNFANADFLLKQAQEISDTAYELRYFAVTGVSVEPNCVFLVASGSELLDLREEHEEPNLE
ncbi:hypothetical protein [Marinobacter mangrovi]|uniref:hypothetical protein n=1 Tax=Marinobacter mangrovi TaxID=2803918 RepID=UPI001931BB4C|nr:hypothetical protein [Marinobacter mangrovi]